MSALTLSSGGSSRAAQRASWRFCPVELCVPFELLSAPPAGRWGA